MDNVIDVACAIVVDHKRKVLVTQRSTAMKLPLKWEFPGGKVEQGETPEACLLREIKEELDIDLEIISALEPNFHDYPDFSIRLIPFICRKISGKICLREHTAYQYIEIAQFKELDWAEADVTVYEQYITLNAF
jgi:8-oxo-dGTP diphosphatase